MGSVWIWLAVIIVFGIICGGGYAWLYGVKSWRQFLRRFIISAIIYAVVAMSLLVVFYALI